MSNRIFEEGPRRGHAAGDTSVEQQASQLASDIRLKTRKKLSAESGANYSPAQVNKVKQQFLNSSTAPGAVKALAKRKLFGEDLDNSYFGDLMNESLNKALMKVFVDGIEPEVVEEEKKNPGERLYKVRVTDKETGNSVVREVSRSKLAELRRNPNIASVEMVEGKTKRNDLKDYDGDGKVESSSKEHAGVVHNAIQRKKGGVPDGNDTRKSTNEEVIFEKKSKKDENKIKEDGIDNYKSGCVKVMPEVKESALSRFQTYLNNNISEESDGCCAKCGKNPCECNKPSVTDVDDARQVKTSMNLRRNKLRAMGLKMSYEPEGEMTEEASDRARDEHQMRGGMAARKDYDRPPARKATNKELGIKPGKTWVQKQMEKKKGKK